MLLLLAWYFHIGWRQAHSHCCHCRKHSHRRHHSNTGSAEKDEVALPMPFAMRA